MFKPNDKVLVVQTGEYATAKATLHQPRGVIPCPVELVDGRFFDESELLQAHPSVLATAEGRDEPREEFKRGTSDRLRYDYELRFAVENTLRDAKLPVDVRGHWRGGADLYEPEGLNERVIRDQHLLGPSVLDDDLRELREALREDRPLNRWVNIGRCLELLTAECSCCGKGRFHLETNGKVVRLSGDDCPLPNGFEPNEWELNVPSGKIVVANDLREQFPLPDGGDDIPSLNTTLGCRTTAQAYAAVGMAHGFVGNTCPGVFRVDEGKFKIANEPADKYWNGKEYVPYKGKPKFKGERVSGVCTDLWWYSLCDADEFERRVQKFGGSLEEAHAEVIDVKPGVYRFRHHDNAVSDFGSSRKETLYATFEWVRDADPVKDFLADWKEVEVNPHAYVQAQARRWPTLYGVVENAYLDNEKVIPWSEMTEEQRTYAWFRVANQALCVIGGGVDWHEKGFPLAKVDASVPDIEPPSFRWQCHWYPFSRPYGGLFREGELSTSFAKLAFRVLESVISFGMNVQDGSHSRDVPYTRKRMLLAVERYRELAERYPVEADPDYVWWLNQEGRAEAWVGRFELGPTFTDSHRKHAEAQRWVPEDTYAVEFDARKLNEGHFSGEYGWARKEDATEFALVEWHDNEQPPEHNCFWTCHAKDTAIPLYSVARVVKVGEVSHMGETLVEVAFDYGTPWMVDTTKRKALREYTERAGIRLLTKEEYESILPTAKHFFEKK